MSEFKSVMPGVLRVDDLAELLKCSTAAVRRLIQKGRIPSRRLGTSVIVLQDELEQCLRLLPQSGMNQPHTPDSGESTETKSGE